jgi:multicomponent Na+:H+ antiporter subunit D
VNWLLVLPLLIPLAGATVSIPLWRWPALQKVLSIAGSLALLAVAVVLLESVRRNGIQATQLGAWPAPFGITLVADLFTAIMVLIASIMALAVSVYSLAGIDATRTRFGYFPLLSFLVMGVCGAFLTGDLFNLYVWFEVLLISSFVLMALGGERHQMEGAIKYVTLNLISSVMFLSAVGILYGMAGTLNMADLAVKLHTAEQPGLVTAVAMLFLAAFGIKAAVFPLFFWLPSSYHTPPVAVSAIFAALLTKVGVYSLVRVFTLLFVDDVGYTHTLLLMVAGVTMVTGVLGAVAQYDFRRLLSFHIVSQIGYLIMGLGLFSPLALAGTVFFMVHVILAKSALFLVSGITFRMQGTHYLKDMGGLYRTHPGLALMFLAPALSLAGIPPLSGFFAKLALVRGGLELGSYAIVAAALAVSILTLFSMIKIWTEAFWKERPPQTPPAPQSPEDLPAPVPGLGSAPALLIVPTAVVGGLTVLLGIGAGPVFDLALEAARQLLDPAEYIFAVLGE